MPAMASPEPPNKSAGASELLPGGIEIFRAGTHRDDAGRSHTFTRAQLQEIADSYNRELREAPLTVGHPRDNLPAYGWVARVYVNERGNLAIDPAQVDVQFAEMVKAGRFKKRSASLYPPDAPHNPTPGKWYLRHVAFLGAQPPAVAGLKDIGFAEYGALDEALNFSQPAGEPAPVQPPEESPMSEQEKAELEKLRADNKALAEANAAAEAKAKAAQDAADAAAAQVQSYAEQAATQRRAGFASFAEAEIKAGRLLPKDKALAIATLEAVATTAQPVSFAEGDTTTQVTAMQMCAWLQGQMSSRTAAVNFGEQAGASGAGAFDARGKGDAEIDQAARQYQREHPSVSYAEAMGHVLNLGA
ncbi:hypothetical protein KUD94_12795 [Comamonas sp. NLF-1-9]|nr:hypothetical protein KUD94_12795 [Comamonas sp. NLF-1-9]